MIGTRNDWKSIALATQTYESVNELGRKTGSILTIPVGSIEQHGYHLPVATDTILVETIAQEGASRVENQVPILVTPAVWPGYSPHHLSVGGTFSARFENLRKILEDIILSADNFDAILLLNGHGGNISLIDSVVTSVSSSRDDIADIFGLTYFQLVESHIDQIRDSELGGMGHGGEFETSLMLHLYPELVDSEKMEGEKRETTYDHERKDLMQGGILSTYQNYGEYSNSGVVGAPELSSEKKGEIIYELLGDELESLLLSIYESMSTK